MKSSRLSTFVVSITRNGLRRYIDLKAGWTIRCAQRVLLLLGLASASTSGGAEPHGLVPLPSEVASPEDNRATPQKIMLGKQLFFDPRLSGDNKTSCATCHVPEKAFADGLARSTGRDAMLLSRNTPSLLNVGFFATFFWDGRAATLEEQALLPMASPAEMNQGLKELEQELSAVPGYVKQFREIFGTNPTRSDIAKSLAAFQRTLVTGPSPFDKYLSGDKDSLSDDAKRGMELFVGDAACVRCHHGPLLSDAKFYRLGIASNDDGRAAVTKCKQDRQKFRTPSLRNVAQTAPYMHDGSLRTLTEVVEFYYRGVPSQTRDGLRPDVNVLQARSYSEVSSLVAFLESLTGAPPAITPPKLP